jgi:Gram-negative bacterial TonB protein C-terminal
MRALVLSSAAFLLIWANLFAAEVQIGPTKPGPTRAPSATPAVALPQYRPALLGAGPLSVINRIDTQGLIRKGQKDATLNFCCSVTKTGEIANSWVYRATPESSALEEDVLFCLDTAVFVPAIYNHQTVHVLFFGTVRFKVVNGKPRLRIFANQETAELKNESDFVGPQPFVGRESKFEGLHYPNDVLTASVSGLVELGMKVDVDGNLKELKLVSEYPPLAGFGRAAAEDFRVARFIPAFRNGKPVECNITLPVYYSP